MAIHAKTGHFEGDTYGLVDVNRFIGTVLVQRPNNPVKFEFFIRFLPVMRRKKIIGNDPIRSPSGKNFVDFFCAYALRVKPRLFAIRIASASTSRP